MALIELKCKNCDRRVIVDERDLDDDAELVICPYCEEPIVLPPAD